MLMKKYLGCQKVKSILEPSWQAENGYIIKPLLKSQIIKWH